jgi:CDP-6-deoxy-D-xylo-4-hexulose-3-dehydrase
MSTSFEHSFPLVDSSFDNQEILRCIETLLGGQLTMGPRVLAFERAFAHHIGARHAVMVNSGSSANLLAVSAAINPLRERRLPAGAHVAVPAVCWSTSVWPLVQLGLKPVLVDVDPGTLNLSLDSMRAALARYPIQALMMVHVLGNSTDLGGLMELVRKHDLMLIEDTCESLGSRFGGKWLGTLGAFGTFSFYFSHHMTTIEGGMVVTDDDKDYDLLKCLRAHGWTREQSNRAQIEAEHPQIDPRFLFMNVGYNVRPMEIQAAFGLEQLGRLDAMNANRVDNTKLIRDAFARHPRWRGQLSFPASPPGVDACWFGFPFLVSPDVALDYRRFTARLMASGIDTRPIVSGNMDLQPAVRLFDIERGLAPFEGAQRIHDRGVFIGVHTRPLDAERVEWLVECVLAALEDTGA